MAVTTVTPRAQKLKINGSIGGCIPEMNPDCFVCSLGCAIRTYDVILTEFIFPALALFLRDSDRGINAI